MASKLPQPTKCAHLFSPQEKGTPLPHHSSMISGLDVWATQDLKSPHHGRLKKAFSISSQVLHKFIPSAVTSHHIPHVLFHSHFINLILFACFALFFAFFFLAGHVPLSCQAQYSSKLGATAGQKSCSSTHTRIRHTLGTLGR